MIKTKKRFVEIIKININYYKLYLFIEFNDIEKWEKTREYAYRYNYREEIQNYNYME